MRFAPAALALAMLAAVTASSGSTATPQRPLDSRAAALLAQGRSALDAGQTEAAVDAFEAALAIQPGAVQVYVNLAEAARKQGLQGKALRYYREALLREPQNQSAIFGEGVALAEKGAIERARRNLARLQQLCGGECAPARDLAAAIAKGPAPRVVTADQIKTQPVVTSN